MTLAVALERIEQIESMLSPADSTAPTSPTPDTTATSAPTAVAASTSPTAFANALQGALGSNTSLAAAGDPASGMGLAGNTVLPIADPSLNSLGGSLGTTLPLSVPGAAMAPPGLLGGVSPLTGVPGTGGAPEMVRLAEGEIGQAEMPPGSNDSPRIAMYRSATAGAESSPGPWCAYFVSWLARSAGEPLGPEGQGFGSVDQLWSWAQGAGRAVPNGEGYQPRPGDLIVFDEHVGMVEGVLPNGQIQTIEGNYGDRVSRNVRGANEAVGYVRMS